MGFQLRFFCMSSNSVKVFFHRGPTGTLPCNFCTAAAQSMEVAEAMSNFQTQESPEKIVKEGKAVLAEGVSTDKVFYNPIQEFNRDFSCLVLSVFFEKLKEKWDKKQLAKATKKLQNGSSSPVLKPFEGRILEVMAATGLRACRYALEIPHVTEVIANDHDIAACDAIKLNAKANNVTHKLTVHNKDARRLMLEFGFDNKWVQAVDLDPFGSAAPFIEGALQCLADGGILMVTCTDTAILCGNFPEACYARYGATSVRNAAHHEISLRIVLNCIAARAMMHEKFIEPLLSLREGHYVRLFLAVHRGAKEAKETVRTAYENAPIAHGNTCDNCGSRLKIGGPIWAGPLHDKEFVTDLITELAKEPGRLGTEKLMLGKLTMIQEELPNQPLYFVESDLFKVVHCVPIPSQQLQSALLHAGFSVSSSHCERQAVKTTAPYNIIWDIIRCWVKKHPIAEQRMSEARIKRILNKEPSFEANFTLHADAGYASKQKKLLRFPTFKRSGPMAKPRRGPALQISPDADELDRKKIKLGHET